MIYITEAHAKSNYADRLQLEKAGVMAIQHCQWEIAKTHYENARALLVTDPHSSNINAKRYDRQIAICTEMSKTSPAMRPVRDNPLYRAEERERIAKYERDWEKEWSGHE